MAYKFQLGLARLSGSVIQEGDVSSSGGNVSSSGDVVVGGRFITGDNTSGKVLIGDGTEMISQAISGDATLADTGALTIANQAVTFAKFQNVGANSVVVRDAATAGVASALSMSSGEIMIGDGTGFTAAALSGDVTMTSGGAVTIANGVVSPAKFADVAANTVLVRDAGTSGDISAKAVASTEILIGNGSGFTAASLSGDVSMTAAGAVTIAANVVEGSMLSGNVAGDGIQYSASALHVELVDTDALTVGASGLDLKDTIAGNRTFSNNVTITGDLTVNGTQTILNVATMSVEDANIEIANNANKADGQGLTIGSGSGQQVLFQLSNSAARLSSSVPLTALNFVGDVVGNADSATVGSTVTLADESTDTSCNIVFSTAATGNQALKTGTNLTFDSANGALTASLFSGDGSGLTGISSDTSLGFVIRTPLNTASTAQSLAGNAGIHTFSDASLNAGNNVTIHLSGASAGVNGWADGANVMIKAPGELSGSHILIVPSGAAGAIDGSSAGIVLESPDAAVSLVYSRTSGEWMIF
jgi:hypothetical protein